MQHTIPMKGHYETFVLDLIFILFNEHVCQLLQHKHTAHK
jgi:hypothetical protein